MGEISKYNISILKNYKNDFSNERNNFISSTYNTFLNSYLSSCSDSIVQIMFSKLKGNYQNIDSKYSAIEKWWDNYLNDAEGLENVLANNAGPGCIREASLSNYVNSIMIELSDYRPDFAQFNYKGLNISEFAIQSPAMIIGNSMGQVNSIGNFQIAKDMAQKMSESVVDSMLKVSAFVDTAAGTIWNNAKTVMNNYVLPKIQEISDSVKNTLDKTNAAIDSATTSVVNSAKEFKEAHIDTIPKIIEYQMALNVDVVNAVVGKITGSEWESKSKEVLAGMTEVELQAVYDYMATNAVVGTTVISLVEGIANVVEWIGDAAHIITTIVDSAGTGIYDGFQALYGLITGNEWESKTKQMWNDTMAEVSETYVEDAFDWFYEVTKFEESARFFTDHFDTARSIGNGLGEAIGIIAISLLTFGIGGAAAGGSAAGGAAAGTAATGISAGQMATVAGVSGFGKGAEKSWGEGANLFEGLGYASAIGIWEGIQYFIGGKISQLTTFLPQATNGATAVLPTLSDKIKNSLLKVFLDTIDSGVEGFVQPGLDLIYKDGYTDANGNYIEFTESESKIQQFLINYCENFEAIGGWGNVGTNAVMGFAGSIIGEGFDLGKLMRQKPVDINTAQTVGEIKGIVEPDKISQLEEPKTLLSQSDVMKNNISFSSDIVKRFNEMELADKLRTINSCSIYDLNKLIGNNEILSEFSINIKERIINKQDLLFINEKDLLNADKNVYDFIKNDEELVSKLTNNNLIVLLERIQKDDPAIHVIIKEIETRIDNGQILFSQATRLRNTFGLSLNSNAAAFSNLPGQLQNKIVNYARELWEKVPKELKMYNYGSTFFQQLLLADMINTKKIDIDAMEYLFKMADKNSSLLETFDFRMIDKEIIDKIGLDYAIEIGQYPELSDKLISIFNNDKNLFGVFSNIIKDSKLDDSLDTFYIKSKNILEFFFENIDSIKNIDNNVLTSNSFIQFILYQNNKFAKGEINRILIDFSTDYDVQFAKECDRLFDSAETIDQMKEAYFQKYFSISSKEVKELLIEYAEHIDSVDKYDSEGLKSILKQLQTISELEDKTILKDLYNNQSFNFNSEEIIYFFENIKSIYLKSYVDILANTSMNINSANITRILDYNGTKVPVIQANGDFAFLVHSSDSGFVVDKTLINDSYIQSWEALKNSKTHGLSTSFISANNIGSSPVQNIGVLYAFTSLQPEDIAMMAPYDINSNIANYGFTSNNKQIYMSPEDMSLSTTRVYNEVVLNRKTVTPDYIIIYSDMSDDLINNAVQAAAEWKIPIVEIDKAQLAEQQIANINSLLDKFEETKDNSLLISAIENYESNISGFRLNTIAGKNDPTSSIDNSFVAPLFTSDKITETLDNYVQNLQDNKTINALIESLESIKSRYEIANSNGSNMISQTQSGIDLNGYIEKLRDMLKDEG